MGGTRDPVTGLWTGLASLQFVTVGDPGNAPDALVMNDGTTGYGSVGYTYHIGTYDVTAAQYCAFLNSVAATDSYGLYNTFMTPASNYPSGFGITRQGSYGSYTYSVTGNANFPMNKITWGDAARFCNWLANGQPTGKQGPATTETGSYTLNGATTWQALMAITRNPSATYAVPSEDEWYKAAYYKGGGTNQGYWLYPTQSDSMPSNFLSSTETNNANYKDGRSIYTDPINKLTAVGAFASSPGPYGTFDMGGDLFQWNEANTYGSYRGLRGGSFDNYVSFALRASYRSRLGPTDLSNLYGSFGFRVAHVPEPATFSLLTLGGLLIAKRRRA